MEHSFSIEMKSKKYVRNISISDVEFNRVLFDGYLGKLERLSHIEGQMLEIKGTNGILRIDISEDELQSMKTDMGLSASKVRCGKNTVLKIG
jgi:hypothetical protein